MRITPTNPTIADYCASIERGEIIVNREYQRNEGVWPDVARSYLIESIVLGYPIPKLSLFQRTDINTRQTVKEIVDGQQRTAAIVDFFKGELQLSTKLETKSIAGCNYEDLEDEDKQKFLDYPLGLDLFVSATPAEIREIFRRMNTYTIALNDEEKRHARFQGEFKWFVNRMTREFDTAFINMGVFAQKSLLRMADCKLITEVCHALIHGVKTTKAAELTELYDEFDAKFKEETHIEAVLKASLNQVLGWEPIHNTELMRPHNFYALVIAVAHVRYKFATLQNIFEVKKKITRFDSDVSARLSTLGNALANDEKTGKFSEFIEASAEKTNVQKQRVTRIRVFCEILLDK
jgi:hypothetical protein